MVTNTANRPSHEREINQYHHNKQKPNHEYSLVKLDCCHLAQWHNVWAFRTSDEHLDDPLACWHTSSSSGHAGNGTVDRPMAQAH